MNLIVRRRRLKVMQGPDVSAHIRKWFGSIIMLFLLLLIEGKFNWTADYCR